MLDDRTVAYLDAVGSGAETIAHLRENGRIVVMLCSFAGQPRIVRLHGRGRVVTAGTPRVRGAARAGGFEEPAAPEALRAVIVVDVARISDSCAYGVPLMAHEGERPYQDAWAAKKLRTGGPDALADTRRRRTRSSSTGSVIGTDTREPRTDRTNR